MDTDSAGDQSQLADLQKAVGWVEELVQEIGSAKAEAKRMQLDLDAESSKRRDLQIEVKALKRQVEQQTRPFVAALIDGDADYYVFHEKFLKRTELGGADACDALLRALQQFVRVELGDVTIHAKIFANIRGLGPALHSKGIINNAADLWAFVAGFNGRNGLFDFVDVGPGKERADFKMIGNIEDLVNNPNCKRSVVACGHDAGYAPFLGQYAGNPHIASRIILLEGGLFRPEIIKLGLQSTKLDGLFCEMRSLSVHPGSRTSLTWAAKASMAGAENCGMGKQVAPGVNRYALKGRLQVVMQNGKRVDKELPVRDDLVRQMLEEKFCFHYFLKGACSMAYCPLKHAYRQQGAKLTEEEFDAMCVVARVKLGFHSLKAGDVCNDQFCLLRH